jgi:prepilin-type processing-associated H-X9-DG protein
VAAILWALPAGVHAGGNIPEEEKPEHLPATRAGATDASSSAQTPDGRSPVVLEGEVEVLHAAELAPRDCLFFVTAPDLSRFGDRLDKLAVSTILRDPVMSRRFAAALEAVRESARDSAKPSLLGFLHMSVAADVDYASSRSLFRKEVAIIGLPPGEGGLRLALVATVAGNRDPLNDVLDSLMGEILTQYPQFALSEKEHSGARIRSLAVTGEFEVSFAYFENLFVVGVGKDTVSELINTYDGGRKKQLAGDKVFKKAEEKIAKGADIFYRVDLAGLVAGLAAQAGPAAETAGYSLIPPESGTLWGSIRLDDEAVRERMEFVGVSKNDGSLVCAIAGDEALASPLRTVGYFPVDTAFYYVSSVSPSETIARMREDPRSAKTVSDVIKTINKYLGPDFENDVLGAFGGELAFGAMLPPGKPPELLLALEVRRTDRFPRAQEVIDGFMERNYTSGIKEEQYRGHVIRYVEPPTKVAESTVRHILLPDPAYTYKEGQPFLLASSRRTLRKAIRQQEHGRSVLTEKPDHGRCVTGLRPRRTTLVYVDLKAGLELLDGQIPTSVGPAITGPFAGNTDMQVILPHLFGIAGVADSARSQVSMDFYGPLGPVSALVLSSVASITKGVGKPQDPTADADRLRAIGAALHLYATDFDRFPTFLSELYAEYLPKLSDFESPYGRRAVKTKEDIDTRSDYVYVSGLAPMDLSNKIIAYGKEYGFGGRGRNVLYLDGNVVFIEEAEFKRLIESQLGK